MSNILFSNKNGNCIVTIHSSGSRTLEIPDNEDLQLDFPLNIDIKVFSYCTLSNYCTFCHESAVSKSEGKEAYYSDLAYVLKDLPEGTELAIGANDITPNFVMFLRWCKSQNYICNITINQLHLRKYHSELRFLINQDLIKGLGISYRTQWLDKDWQKFGFINYPHSVLHCIAGLNEPEEISNTPYKKILILGYKTFGKGIKYQELFPVEIKNNLTKWNYSIQRLLQDKEIVSFDNLGLDQLNVKRFLSTEEFNSMYNGEHSMYIDAVESLYRPSSRNSNSCKWEDKSIQEYFAEQEKIKNENL